MATIEKPADDLLHSLAYALAKTLLLLRRLAVKPKHAPGGEAYQEIARRQVEHLKQSGVEKIIGKLPGRIAGRSAALAKGFTARPLRSPAHHQFAELDAHNSGVLGSFTK
jgi:hypothetical protein